MSTVECGNFFYRSTLILMLPVLAYRVLYQAAGISVHTDPQLTYHTGITVRDHLARPKV